MPQTNNESGSIIRRSKWFWIVLVASLVVKGLFFYKQSFIPARFYTPDGYHYKQLADNLIKYGSFAALSPRTGRLYPEIIRTPGYPAFLAAVILCIPQDFPLEYIVAFIQIILASLTCGLVYLLAKKIFNRTAAVIAGLLSVCDMTSTVLANLMLSDTLFVFSFFCSFYLSITGIMDRKKGRLATAGFFLGLATLFRPISLYAVLIFMCLFIYLRKKISPYNALFFLLPFFLIIGSWKARNYLRTGNSAFSAQSSVFIMGVASDIKSEVEKRPFRETENYFKQHIMDRFEREESKSDSLKKPVSAEWEIIIREAGINRLCTTVFLEQISGYPDIFLTNYLNNLIRFVAEPDYISYLWCFGGPPSFHLEWSWDKISRINRYGFSLVILSQAILLFVLWSGFVYANITMLSWDDKWMGLMLITVVLYFTLTTSMAHIEMRYRMPVIPFLALGAGYGISRFTGLIE